MRRGYFSSLNLVGISLTLLLTLVPFGTLHATPQDSVVVDGAQHPELIPDERAYHIVLLTASASERSTDVARKDVARKYANAVVASLPFVEQDRRAFADLAAQYRKSLEQLEDEQRTVLGDHDRQRSIYNRKQQLLENTIGALREQLTVTGVAQVLAYAQRAKRNMKLFALPNMDHAATGLMGTLSRFFSLPTVHAQMNPTGTAYSSVAIDNTNGAIIGEGITDATSDCGCHQTRATSYLTFGSFSAWNEYDGSEFSEAYAYLPLDDSQFSDGTITVNSTHWAYCPIIGTVFLQTQTFAQVSASFIQAYYMCDTDASGQCASNHMYHRCTLRDRCDQIAAGRLPTIGYYPRFGLFNVLRVDNPIFETCITGKVVVPADKCITPDPRP